MAQALTGAEIKLPAGATDAEKLRFFVSYAVLAPSSHNTQPWLFRIGNHGLDLIADRTRALPVVDPHDRALTISCGAALETLIIAARRFGYLLAVDEFPGSDPDLLATVQLLGEVKPSNHDQALFRAISQRRSTRTKYDNRILPAQLRNVCRNLADAHGIELTIVEEKSHRSDIADLVAEGDRAQFGDPSFRRELAAWVHSRHAVTRDGMSGDSFGMPDVLSSVGALVIRTFDIGDGVAAGDRDKIVGGSPLLAVFSSTSDDATDWLATGRALGIVLLTITAAGATAAFLNQPVEVPELRTRLRATAATKGIPQLLLRFGYGKELEPSARRPTEDVLIDG